MMFEQQIEKLNKTASQENTQLIPVSSLEEVAIHLRDNDDEFTYEHILVQIKHTRTKKITPPPFRGPSSLAQNLNPASEKQNTYARKVVSQETAPAGATATKSGAITASKPAQVETTDIPFLAQNADLLLQAGELELARNVYRAILKTGESSDVAYAGLALCADREGLVDQAIQFAWDSVAFAPNKKGYQVLSQLLVQQGRDQEAAQALNRALKTMELSTQEKAEYFKMIGNCHSRLGQNVDAERAFKKALELSPASDEVQANLGSLYLEQGQTSEAKCCYQDAIASNGQNDKAWVGLGLCFVTEGDKEAAHEAFARSLEKNLRNSTAIFHLVKCAYEIKKYSTAEKMLSNYVEVAPVSPSLLYSLAGLQFHVGKKREASLTAKRILQIKGDHQGARDLIKRIDAE